MGNIHKTKSKIDKRRIPRARIGNCLICGKEYRAVSDFKDRIQKYCGYECFAKRFRKVNICKNCKREIHTSVGINKKYCDQHCRNLHYRETMKGENSPFWIDGRTSRWHIIKSSAKYREWRTAVFKRDGYQCIKCGAKGVYLEADHIKPKSKYPKLMFDINNGRTLCKPCHRATDTFGRKATKYGKAKKIN